MSVATILLPIVALHWGALTLPHSEGKDAYHNASVTFEKGKCWFWTGDAGLSALQFQSDLESRFDRERGIIISHPAGTPTRCIKLAYHSAKRAGFRVVKSMLSADAGPIPPPSSAPIHQLLPLTK